MTGDDRRFGHALAGILLLGAALRLVHANAEFWFDEIVTVETYVRASWSHALTSYIANNHVLNSVLARLAVSIAGESPAVVRAPAIAFGIAGIWAFAEVARRLWPRAPAILGTFLFAVSYYDIYYSQNARGYSAFLFFALLSTSLVLDRLRSPAIPARPDWPRDAALALAVALGLLALPLMLFVVAGQVLTIAIWRRWRLFVPVAAGAGAAAAIYLPMAHDLIAFFGHPSYTGFRLTSTEFAHMVAPIALVLAAGAIAGLPVLARLARRDPQAAVLLCAPALLTLAAPFALGQGVYPRTFMYGLAFGYLLLIEVFDYATRRSPAIAWAIAGLITAASAAQLAPYYRLPKQGFRQAIAYVDAHRGPDESRAGVMLAGYATRFYDPAIVAIDNDSQLRAWTAQSRHAAWIVSTFPTEMAADDPALADWLAHNTDVRATFPGVVGDGVVRVHYWPGR